jgi:ATP-dependent RNA helicase RhlE
MTNPTNPPQFSNLGIASNLLTLLEQLGFTTPTPIQHQTIPSALEGKDIVGIAQTGTGKTLAFGVPLIQRIALHKGKGLVMLPTRELALQVDETLRKVGRGLGIRTAVLIGGASMHLQLQQLRNRPHVIIATPGRLVDHVDQKTVSLNEIKIVVLDEADRMFDIGFMPQIKKILNAIPKERQMLLFSATMPTEIAQLTAQFMRMPLRIEVAPAGTTVQQIEQEIFIIPKDSKMQLLDKLLADTDGTTLVFSRTKHGAKRIAAGIRSMGHSAVELHSNRSLAQRKEALAGFRSGKYRILVATDIAARGIDVSTITLVINYDLPDNSEDYVHRIGRTGRAGRSGKAVSFVAPEEKADIKSIERLIRKTLPILALPVLPPRRAAPPFHHDRQSSAPRRHGFAPRSGGGSRSPKKPFRFQRSPQKPK